jgi:hypothetical protein
VFLRATLDFYPVLRGAGQGEPRKWGQSRPLSEKVHKGLSASKNASRKLGAFAHFQIGGAEARQFAAHV